MSLKGIVTPPGDKSISHRLALLAILAEGSVRASNLSRAADVRSSLGALAALGGVFRPEGEAVVIEGLAGRVAPAAAIDCGNSGTTMRLLMGLLAGRQGSFVLDGDDSLRRRPMERVAGPLRRMGAAIACALEGGPPVRITGRPLRGVDHRLPVASAQLKSALLLAGLQAEGVTRVSEPALSRDHTERLLAGWGARIEPDQGGVAVRASTLRPPADFAVPGDPSSAAFFLCAAAILPGSDVTVERTLLNPTRIGFLEVLRRMGAAVELTRQGEEPEPWGRVRVSHGPRLRATTVRAEEVPLLIDEIPILALVASQAEGVSVFEGVGELRLKESDRLQAMADQLGLMGADLRVAGERLVAAGPTRLQAPARLDSGGDHRVAMTLRLAGLAAEGWPEIEGEACAAISYPEFQAHLQGLRR